MARLFTDTSPDMGSIPPVPPSPSPTSVRPVAARDSGWLAKAARAIADRVHRRGVAAAAASEPGAVSSLMESDPGPGASRSIPVPAQALSRLLDRVPLGRKRFHHLALLETQCLQFPEDPFTKLPPRVVEMAIRQLDLVLPAAPDLRVLRLQLERQRQTHRARVEALLAAEDRKWHPEEQMPAASAGANAWVQTGFMDTQPYHAPGHTHSSM